MADDAASLSATLGAALRRCREERDLTQDDVSRRVRERFGLLLGRPTISHIESGDRELTLTEVVVLLDVLETDLKKLLGDAGELELVHDESGGGFLVTGPNLVSGLVKGPMPKIQRVAFSRMSASRLRELERAELGEMDYKAAKRLGVEPLEVAAAARRLYRRSLTDEREARLKRRGLPAAMTPAQRRAIRGHVSRELYVELAEALKGRTYVMAHVQRKCSRCRRSVEEGRRSCGACGSRSVRYVARWVDPEGAERSESFARRADADSKIATVEADKRRGRYVDPEATRRPIGELLESWYAKRAPRLKPTTAAGYRSLIATKIAPEFGRREIGSLRPSDVDAWIGSMAAEGLSPSRIRQAVGLLSQVLAAAERDGAIGRNPTTGVERPGLRREEARWLEPATVEAIAAEAPAPYDLAIRTMGTVGLRFGETAALRRSSVDPLRRRLRVAESVSEVGGVQHFGTPKSHAARLVPLTTSLAEAFARRLKAVVDGELVFPSPDGSVLGYSNFRRRIWRPALERAGVAPVGVHALRHSAAAAMIHAGASPKSVQAILGHASAAFTLTVYGHVFDADLDAIAEGLERVVAAPQTGPRRDPDGTPPVIPIAAPR